MMTSVFGYCKSDPNIPIEHLDYGYIEKCQDINKLQKILTILRSGEEGKFPALETFAEEQLAKKKPDSALLEKIRKEMTSKELPKDDLQDIIDGLKDFPSAMTNGSANGSIACNLPPIRSSKDIDTEKQESKECKPVVENGNKSKKVAPRSYDEWEKVGKQIDDGDLDKICQEKTTKTVDSKPQKHAHDLLTQKERESQVFSSDADCKIAAENEKNKGNEAFRCGDFKEALIYYNRSIHISPSVLSYNNRAITLIKLERFLEALSDCDTVINEQPDNIKAYLRRGIANQSLQYLEKALEDFAKVIELEPSNKRGKELFAKLSKELENKKSEVKKKGRRLKIEEVSGNVKANDVKEVKIEETTKVENCVGRGGNISNEVKCEYNGNGVKYVDSKVTNDIKKEVDNKVSEGHVKSENGCCEKAAFRKDGLKDESIKDKEFADEKNTSRVERLKDASLSESGSIRKDNEGSKKCVTELPASVVGWKDEGNQMHKSGRYDKASELYTACIHTLMEDPSLYTEALATFFSNRSSCHLKMGNTHQCIHDCDKAIKFSPSSKAYLRRANAYESLEKYLDAYRDYQNLLQMEANNPNALQALSRLGNVLRSEYGSRWREKLLKIDVLSTRKRNYNSINTSTTATRENLSDLSRNDSMNTDKSSNCSIIKEGNVSQQYLSDESNKSLPQKAVLDGNIADDTLKSCGKKVDTNLNGHESKTFLNCHKAEKNEMVENKITSKTKQCAKKLCEENAKELAGKIDIDKKGNISHDDTEKIKKDSTGRTFYSERKEKTVRDRFLEMKNEGNGYVQKGKYEEAARNYSQCIELLPEEVTSFTNRALCYVKLKQPEKAVEDCTKALLLQPDNVKALFRRAQGRRMKKEYKEALADLKRILKLEPNNKAAKEEMEVCKMEFHSALRDIQAKNESAKKKQSMGESIKIPIEEVLSEQDEIPVKAKLTTKIGKCPLAKASTSSKVPTLKKMTAYEFLHAWNGIKSNKTSLYADLLMQIEPSKLPELLSNKLDGEILKNFIRTVNEQFTTKDTYKQGIQLLKHLCHSSRFLTMLMFLNTSEKTLLSRTIDSLESRAKHNVERSLLADVNSLRASYLLL